MRCRLAALVPSLLVVLATSACATSTEKKDPIEREMSRYGPPLCTQQDISPLKMSIQTCVQNNLPNEQAFGPDVLPSYMQMRNPYVVTVVETPAGRFSNPAMWNVEISRNGEVIAQRAFNAPRSAVEARPNQDESGRVQIRSAMPLGHDGTIEPGIYKFHYTTSDGEDLGTTTLEVLPSE